MSGELGSTMVGAEPGQRWELGAVESGPRSRLAEAEVSVGNRGWPCGVGLSEDLESRPIAESRDRLRGVGQPGRQSLLGWSREQEVELGSLYLNSGTTTGGAEDGMTGWNWNEVPVVGVGVGTTETGIGTTEAGVGQELLGASVGEGSRCRWQREEDPEWRRERWRRSREKTRSRSSRAAL